MYRINSSARAPLQPPRHVLCAECQQAFASHSTESYSIVAHSIETQSSGLPIAKLTYKKLAPGFLSGETLGQIRSEYTSRSEGVYISIDSCEEVLDPIQYMLRILRGTQMPDDHIVDGDESVELFYYEFFHPQCSFYNEQRSGICLTRETFEAAGFENFQVAVENGSPGVAFSHFKRFYQVRLIDRHVIRIGWHRRLLEIDYSRTPVKNGLETPTTQNLKPGVVLVEGYLHAEKVLREIRQRMESPIPWLGPM